MDPVLIKSSVVVNEMQGGDPCRKVLRRAHEEPDLVRSAR